jgi:hypothetical protein
MNFYQYCPYTYFFYFGKMVMGNLHEKEIVCREVHVFYAGVDARDCVDLSENSVISV